MDDKDNTANITKKQYDILPYARRDIPSVSDLRYPDYASDENIHLRDYLNVILKRKWVVLVFFSSVIVTTTILSFLMVPVYQSTVILKISSQNPDALSMPGLPFSNTNSKDYYTTQYELLKSRSLAEKVIKKLDLAKNDNFLPVQGKLSKTADAILYPIKSVVSAFMSLFNSKDVMTVAGTPGKQEEIPVYLSNALISRLSVSPVKDSQLVKVIFECNDPGTFHGSHKCHS